MQPHGDFLHHRRADRKVVRLQCRRSADRGYRRRAQLECGSADRRPAPPADAGRLSPTFHLRARCVRTVSIAGADMPSAENEQHFFLVLVFAVAAGPRFSPAARRSCRRLCRPIASGDHRRRRRRQTERSQPGAAIAPRRSLSRRASTPTSACPASAQSAITSSPIASSRIAAMKSFDHREAPDRRLSSNARRNHGGARPRRLADGEARLAA